MGPSAVQILKTNVFLIIATIEYFCNIQIVTLNTVIIYNHPARYLSLLIFA